MDPNRPPGTLRQVEPIIQTMFAGGGYITGQSENPLLLSALFTTLYVISVQKETKGEAPIRKFTGLGVFYAGLMLGSAYN